MLFKLLEVVADEDGWKRHRLAGFWCGDEWAVAYEERIASVLTAMREGTSVSVGPSVVSFDGAVVEFFGFMEIGSHRFHVAMLKEIEIIDRRLLGTAINVAAHPSMSWQIVPSFHDGQRAQLEALIVEIHAARDACPR